MSQPNDPNKPATDDTGTQLQFGQPRAEIMNPPEPPPTLSGQTLSGFDLSAAIASLTPDGTFPVVSPGTPVAGPDVPLPPPGTMTEDGTVRGDGAASVPVNLRPAGLVMNDDGSQSDGGKPPGLTIPGSGSSAQVVDVTDPDAPPGEGGPEYGGG